MRRWDVIAALLLTALHPGPMSADEGEVIEIIEELDKSDEATLRETESGSVEVIAVPEGAAARTLATLLAGAVGVQIEQLGGLGAFAQVSVRGSASDHVAVYLDGVPLQRASGGGVNLADIPLEQIERIEVWRGMAPADLPGMPAGGAINLITKEKEDGVSGSLTGGSFVTRGASVQLQRSGNSAQLTTFGHYLGSRGNFPFDDDNGTPYNATDDAISRRQNNDFDEGALHLRVSGDADGAGWQGDVDLFAADRGVPGVATVQASSPRLHSGRALAAFTLAPKPLAERFGLMIQADTGAFRDAFTDPDGELGLGSRDVVSHTRFVGGNGAVRTLNSARASLSLGVAPRVEAFQQLDRRMELAGNKQLRVRGDVSVVADLSPLENLWLSPSLRVARVADRFDSEPAVARNLASPALGLRYSPVSGLWLRGSVWTGQRVPAFYELFGDRGAVVGNPALVPEHVRGVEAGVSHQHRRSSEALFFGELGGFYKQAEDLIQLVQNSQSTSRAVNVAEARLYGGEGRGSVSLKHFGVQGDITYLVTEDRGADPYYVGNSLPRRPRLEGGVDVWAEPGFSRATSPWLRLEAELRLTSGTWLDRANLQPIPPRRRLAAQAQVRPPGSGLAFTLRGENLLGEDMVDFSGYPLPGRSVFATVAWAPPGP